jgi:hypothetical protein
VSNPSAGACHGHAHGFECILSGYHALLTPFGKVFHVEKRWKLIREMGSGAYGVVMSVNPFTLFSIKFVRANNYLAQPRMKSRERLSLSSKLHVFLTRSLWRSVRFERSPSSVTSPTMRTSPASLTLTQFLPTSTKCMSPLNIHHFLHSHALFSYIFLEVNIVS